MEMLNPRMSQQQRNERLTAVIRASYLREARSHSFGRILSVTLDEGILPELLRQAGYPHIPLLGLSLFVEENRLRLGRLLSRRGRGEAPSRE